jgi:F-type H+-transporting ATPase subunit b
MPQLDFATYASQIFWLSVIFTILYYYLSKGPLPVIREVLHSRQSRIANDLKKAESLKKEAESAEEDFTTAIADARQKASKILLDAYSKAAEEEAVRNAKVEKTFSEQNKEAEQRIIGLRKDAAIRLIPIATEAAILMTEKLIGKKVDFKHAEAVVMEIKKEISIK